jgi:hypothetical protein
MLLETSDKTKNKARFTANTQSYGEIGRLGVLFDTWQHEGRNRVVLTLHHRSLNDETCHVHVANLSTRLMGEGCSDKLLPAATEMVAHGDARISMYFTRDCGRTWQVRDVTSSIQDFVIHGTGEVTVRSGDRKARLSAIELLRTFSRDRPAVLSGEGRAVDETAVLVRFTVPELNSPSYHATPCISPNVEL